MSGPNVELFIRQSQEVHQGRFTYAEALLTYAGKNSPVDLCCVEHGKFTAGSAGNHLKGKGGCCPKCKNKASSDGRKGLNSGKSKSVLLKKQVIGDKPLEAPVKRPSNKEAARIAEENRLKDNVRYQSAIQVMRLVQNCCEKAKDYNSHCADCKRILRYIRDTRNATHVCEWIISDTKEKCNAYCREDQEVCEKHKDAHNDKKKGVRRCFRNGCDNILVVLDAAYCVSCKEKMNKKTKDLRLSNNAAKVKREREEFEVPIEFQQWLSGFFDGDGSVMIQEFQDGTYALTVCVTQADKRVLSQIMKYYPSNVRTLDVRNENVNKPVFNLKYNGTDALRIVEDMLKFSIVKHAQLLLAFEFISHIKLQNKDDLVAKKQIYEEVKSLKDINEYKSIVVDSSRLTKDYVAGLFDAEGCVVFTEKSSPCVKIAQLSGPNLLTAIAQMFGGKHRYEAKDAVWESKGEILLICKTLVTHLYLKKPQVVAMIEYMTCRSEYCKEDFIAIIHNDKYRFRPNKPYLPVSNFSLVKRYDALTNAIYSFDNASELKREKVSDDFDNYQENYLRVLKLKDDIENALLNPANVAIDDKIFMLETKLPDISMAYCESLIYNPKLFNPFRFEIEIVEVKDNLIPNSEIRDRDLWTWIHLYTASYKTTTSVGRNQKFLVREKNTQQYCGILCLGSDLYQYSARDNFINWTDLPVKEDEDIPYAQKRHRLCNITNIMTCVPVQPFGYNFNGGKLLAMLCFSDEVLSAIESKHKDTIAALTTFSLKPKSVMYERTYLKHIGQTRGHNTSKIPERLYQEGMMLIKNIGKESLLGNKDTHQWKTRRTAALLKFLKVDANVLKANEPRGVYIGFTGAKQTALDFLQGKTENFKRVPKSAAFIVLEWANRWAINRSQGLIAIGYGKKGGFKLTDTRRVGKDDSQYDENDEESLHFFTKKIIITKEIAGWKTK